MEPSHSGTPSDTSLGADGAFLRESAMESYNVVLTFESLDEILWCVYSNETSSAVLLHGTICFSIFYKIKLGIFHEF